MRMMSRNNYGSRGSVARHKSSAPIGTSMTGLGPGDRQGLVNCVGGMWRDDGWSCYTIGIHVGRASSRACFASLGDGLCDKHGLVNCVGSSDVGVQSSHCDTCMRAGEYASSTHHRDWSTSFDYANNTRR